MSTDESREPLPILPSEGTDTDMRPWEQRAVGAMGDGGDSDAYSAMSAAPGAPKLFATDDSDELAVILGRQIATAGVQHIDAHTAAAGDGSAAAQTNAAVWELFTTERLYDTKRVSLEQFHLFEWFPLSPGLYHTRHAAIARRAAFQEIQQQGQTYFHPRGKAQMVQGGVGAVRLLPARVDGEDYYFMTASSSGICHQGFPVLVPRHFYGPIKERILHFGAAPVSLSGEMRYVRDQDAEVAQLFGGRRDLPRLYLAVDQLELLDRPRDGVDDFAVSVVVSFYGVVDAMAGTYVTFATFNPRDSQGVERVCDWIEEFYVQGLHNGQVVTDFDAVRSRFPQAVFGLSTILRGELNQHEVQKLLVNAGLANPDQAAHATTVINTYYIGTIANSTGVAIGPGARANVTGAPPAN
jgi:hypothetical protein